MFTPPPSPAPPRNARHVSPSPSLSDEGEGSAQYLTIPSSSSGASSNELLVPPRAPLSTHKAAERYATSLEAKRLIGRRIKWTVLLVPAVLFLITLTTRYVSHPPFLDLISADRASWYSWPTPPTEWHFHKRHASPDPDPQQGSASIAFPTPTTSSQTSSAPSSSASSAVNPSETIPTIPSTAPALPTPFPQPLDTSLSSGFASQACQNVLLNMTQSTAFRSCRSFALLWQSSDAFIQQAQENTTAINAITWGTCNTNLAADQCAANMNWFSSQLQTTCADELKANNAIVGSTLLGLKAYSLLRKTACIADPSTNAYCFVEALHNSNPADLYLYSLPLGLKLPRSSKPTCSTCAKSIMALYAQEGGSLSAISTTYSDAADIMNKACGAGYAQSTFVSSASGRMATIGHTWVAICASMVVAFFVVWS